MGSNSWKSNIDITILKKSTMWKFNNNPISHLYVFTIHTQSLKMAKKSMIFIFLCLQMQYVFIGFWMILSDFTS